MTPEEKDDQQLWQLLGKAKQPSVSPFFARNVLRAVRAEQETSKPTSVTPAAIAWLFRRWRLALGGALAVLILGVATPSLLNKSRRDVPALLAQQNVADPDYDTIEHLDELLAYEEDSLWLDDSSD